MLRENTGDMSPIAAFSSPSTPPPNGALDHIFRDESPPRAAATSSQLDDVFGCSPPRSAGLSRHASPAAASQHVSDIPRLRSIHVTAGYRDGIAESKAGHVQEGFDEGFPLGAVLGLRAGWVLGGLEGIAVALKSAALERIKDPKTSKVDAAQKAEEMYDAVRQQLLDARKDLDMTVLFGQEYFDEEGIWRYHVDEQEGDVTFEDVASKHPLISKWASVVDDLAKKSRVDLKILDRRSIEDSDDELPVVG